MFDGTFRKPVDKAVKPIGNALRKTGLTPDHLTILGLLVGIGAAVAIGSGRLRLGLLLVILAALPDLFDGALAKATDASSQRGAFFDSTVDRVTDAFLLGGIAWYFASTESPYMTVLPFAVMAVSSIISYERAKAESLGIEAKGGLMEHAERIIALCVGLLFPVLLDPDSVDHAGPHHHHGDSALPEGVEAGRGRAGHCCTNRDAAVHGARVGVLHEPSVGARACRAGRPDSCLPDRSPIHAVSPTWRRHRRTGSVPLLHS